ncbi:MAG TPA: energy transducer TonB [Clostridia bacterium]|nr:energy transducer TonB [Clostridia bacterium]
MKSARPMSLLIAISRAVFMLVTIVTPTIAGAEDGRKVKEQIQPAYPELAKSMNISGSVKLEVTIASQGGVKKVKVLGGHPVLADAASRAVSRWRYEPGVEETRTVIVDFKR